MALLDVSLLLTDPDLVDSFTVIRRVEVVGNNGRNTFSPLTFPGVHGVVTAISPSDLDRKDDYQTMARSISIVTNFRLQGEVTGAQPDIIVWRGDNYVVKSIDLYPQFGRGFVQVECTSMDLTDVPIPAAADGPGLRFNAPMNSQYLPI